MPDHNLQPRYIRLVHLLKHLGISAYGLSRLLADQESDGDAKRLHHELIDSTWLNDLRDRRILNWIDKRARIKASRDTHDKVALPDTAPYPLVIVFANINGSLSTSLQAMQTSLLLQGQYRQPVRHICLSRDRHSKRVKETLEQFFIPVDALPSVDRLCVDAAEGEVLVIDIGARAWPVALIEPNQAWMRGIKCDVLVMPTDLSVPRNTRYIPHIKKKKSLKSKFLAIHTPRMLADSEPNWKSPTLQGGLVGDAVIKAPGELGVDMEEAPGISWVDKTARYDAKDLLRMILEKAGGRIVSKDEELGRIREMPLPTLVAEHFPSCLAG